MAGVVPVERLTAIAATWFPGSLESVGLARRFVAGVLGDGCHGLDDVLLMVSEIAANAIRHTASGELGGWFDLTVSVTGDAIRVAVADRGSASEPCVPGASADMEGGRGLSIVDALAVGWGHTGGQSGRVVWFEVSAGAGELAGSDGGREAPDVD